MKFLFEILLEKKAGKNEILFYDTTGSYSLLDAAKKASEICPILQKLKSNNQINQIFALTDNSFIFTSLLIASWSLGLQVVQPNSIADLVFNESSSHYFFTEDDKVVKHLEEKKLLNHTVILTQKLNNYYSEASLKNFSDLILRLENFLEQGDEAFERMLLIQQSSGSTGSPKYLSRSALSYEGELLALKASINYFSDLSYKPCSSCFITTVPLYHAYGVVFRYFIPLLLLQAQLTFAISYQEQFKSSVILNLIPVNKRILISSPAFYKRLDENLSQLGVDLMLSAGGKLQSDVLNNAKNVFNAELLEIYGSTETGVIGYRFPEKTSDLWSPLLGNTVRSDDKHDGTLILEASYLDLQDEGIFRGEDVIALYGDKFALLGRSGRIVKVEDNRISLDDVESAISTLFCIKDCATVTYARGSREYVGALIVLSQEGLKQLSNMTWGRFCIMLRSLLKEHLASLAIPRLFILAETIPVTATGKISYSKVRKLFDEIS